jgi:hypothetical protein
LRHFKSANNGICKFQIRKSQNNIWSANSKSTNCHTSGRLAHVTYNIVMQSTKYENCFTVKMIFSNLLREICAVFCQSVYRDLRISHENLRL